MTRLLPLLRADHLNFASRRAIAAALPGPCIDEILDSGHVLRARSRNVFLPSYICDRVPYLFLFVHFGICSSLILENWIPSCNASNVRFFSRVTVGNVWLVLPTYQNSPGPLAVQFFPVNTKSCRLRFPIQVPYSKTNGSLFSFSYLSSSLK